MSHQINIRNTTNTGWVNLLEARYHTILDIGDHYSANNVEDALTEVFVEKTQQEERTTDPSAGDYQYPIGTIWTNTLNNTAYLCTDNTISYAVWKLITSTSSVTDIEDIVGAMVEDNVEQGIDVTYDNINGKLDFDVHDPNITLTGAVNGSGQLTNLSDLTIVSTGEFDNKGESNTRYVNVDGDTMTGNLNLNASFYLNNYSVNTISNDFRLLENSSRALITEQAMKLNTNISWINLVLSKRFNTVATPGSSASPSAAPLPSNGDRYIVADNATGAWEFHEDEIAEYNDTNWIFLPYNESQTVYVEDEKRYYIYNSSEWVVMLVDVNIEVTDTLNYFTSDYLDGVLNELYNVAPGIMSGLEKVSENSKSGWRFINQDPTFYGDIGINAVDLSTSTGISSVMGATGDYSYSTGLNTIASGSTSFVCGYNTISQNEYSFTSGKFNIGDAPDTIFEIGVGDDDITRKNAFEIYIDGTVTAPESTVPNIHIKGPKTLITREYFDDSTPNINLLINTDFMINQRDYVEGSVLSWGHYGHDMWVSDPHNYGAVGAKLVKFNGDFIIGGGGNPCIYSQKNDDILSYHGKTCTVSINYGELTVSGCGCPYTNLNSTNGMSVTFTIDSSDNDGFFYISNGTDTSGAQKIFNGLKFELGSYSTRYVVRPLSYTLQSCLDYFERVKSIDGIETPSFAFGSFYDSSSIITGRAYFNFLRKIKKPTFTTFNTMASTDSSSSPMSYNFSSIATTGCFMETDLSLTAQIHDYVEFLGIDATSYIDVDANYYS